VGDVSIFLQTDVRIIVRILSLYLEYTKTNQHCTYLRKISS